MGGKSSIDVWLLAIGLALELALAMVGGLATGANCNLPLGTLLISNHIGNLVTSSSFAVACLMVYLNLTGPSLAYWIQLEADEVLRHYALKTNGNYVFRAPPRPQGYAVEVFEACVDLPQTVKELRRSKSSRGNMRQGHPSEVAAAERNKYWQLGASHLRLGTFQRRMIEGRGDKWLAAAAIWLMIFVTGQALVLFFTEVFFGEQCIACWLLSATPWFPSLPVEFGYVISFGGIIVGVGLFRFRTMIQSSLEVSLPERAQDLSLQLRYPNIIPTINRAGPGGTGDSDAGGSH